jgi:hypothetical protein
MSRTHPPLKKNLAIYINFSSCVFTYNLVFHKKTHFVRLLQDEGFNVCVGVFYLFDILYIHTHMRRFWSPD